MTDDAETDKDQTASLALRCFYGAVLLISLIGSAQGAQNWLGWGWLPALVAVSMYELGGAALFLFADRRRQKGERALAARLVSAGFAAGAVAVQFFGHSPGGHPTGTAWFFSGLSAAAYAIWLLDAGARRRDALRGQGKLAETPPVYGVIQWCRHPWLTHRARSLAVARSEQRMLECLAAREAGKPSRPVSDPLGRDGSLAAAAAQLAEQHRLSAIRRALRRRIARSVDPTMAKIAVNTYDLGAVAHMIASSADYPALAGLLTAELDPARIAGQITGAHGRRTTKARGRRRQAVAVSVAWPGAAPAGVDLLPIIAPARQAAPVRLDLPAQPAPPAVETAPQTAQTDVLDLDIKPALVPYVRRVMQAHPDWHLTIALHGRHPEALTYQKIKTAAETSGQQIAADVRTTLLKLTQHPEAAEACLGVERELVAV